MTNQTSHSFETLFAFNNDQKKRLRYAGQDISSSEYGLFGAYRAYDHHVCLHLCDDDPDDYVGTHYIDDKT